MSTLYLVATPIGNLSDLSPRAREVLSTVDFIAAEDTRVTQKLLNACELPKKPMISYYEHNRRARGEAVLEKLLTGETCALVTDAGTPAVSDPGEDLVALCAEHDVPHLHFPLSILHLKNSGGIELSTLYLVATPIGNLSDLSPRAREVLSTVDFIAAEDTRVTQKLLNACELPKKPMISYYEHNRRARGEAVLEKLLTGETCALVTDAGTPAVSDPGEDLVALCAEHDVPVIPIPGCCAAVCALAASGLPTGRWCFEGFLSVNKKARREHLDTLQGEKRTMIFYEAPHKLCATLRDLRDAFGGDRRLSLSRELTKLHEQTLRMTLDEAVAYFDANAPRGEFVLILEGAPDEPETEQDEAERLASAAEAVRRRMEQGQTQKDAVKAVSAETGVKKNALYRYVLDHEE